MNQANQTCCSLDPLAIKSADWNKPLHSSLPHAKGLPANLEIADISFVLFFNSFYFWDCNAITSVSPLASPQTLPCTYSPLLFHYTHTHTHVHACMHTRVPRYVNTTCLVHIYQFLILSKCFFFLVKLQKASIPFLKMETAAQNTFLLPSLEAHRILL